MDLSGILSIAGYPGLFKMISQMKSGVLVESLVDGKRMPAYSTQRVLSLEEISIYTMEDDFPLADIFDALSKKNNGKPALNPKKASADELRAGLKEVLPNYDEDRVYTSDIKKLFQWYNLLAESGLVTVEKENKAEKPAAKKKAAKADSTEKKATKKKPAAKAKKAVKEKK